MIVDWFFQILDLVVYLWKKVVGKSDNGRISGIFT